MFATCLSLGQQEGLWLEGEPLSQRLLRAEELWLLKLHHGRARVDESSFGLPFPSQPLQLILGDAVSVQVIITKQDAVVDLEAAEPLELSLGLRVEVPARGRYRLAVCKHCDDGATGKHVCDRLHFQSLPGLEDEVSILSRKDMPKTFLHGCREGLGLMHKAALVDGCAARSSPPGTYAHTRPSFRVSPMAAIRRVRHNATATVAVLSQHGYGR